MRLKKQPGGGVGVCGGVGEGDEVIGGGYQIRSGGGLSSYQLAAGVIPP